MIRACIKIYVFPNKYNNNVLYWSNIKYYYYNYYCTFITPYYIVFIDFNWNILQFHMCEVNQDLKVILQENPKEKNTIRKTMLRCFKRWLHWDAHLTFMLTIAQHCDGDIDVWSEREVVGVNK